MDLSCWHTCYNGQSVQEYVDMSCMVPQAYMTIKVEGISPKSFASTCNNDVSGVTNAMWA
jgi:hypothetical protein